MNVQLCLPTILTSSCSFPSAECEDLIRRLLCTDPLKRITINEIVCHKWIKISGDDPAFEKLIEESLSSQVTELRTMNQAVLQHMQNLGLDREDTIKVGTDAVQSPSYLRSIHLALDHSRYFRIFYEYLYSAPSRKSSHQRRAHAYVWNQPTDPCRQMTDDTDVQNSIIYIQNSIIS